MSALLDLDPSLVDALAKSNGWVIVGFLFWIVLSGQRASTRPRITRAQSVRYVASTAANVLIFLAAICLLQIFVTL